MVLKGDLGKLEIKILRRSNSETEDYWDANWLESEVRIEVPGFKTFYVMNLRVDDLLRFYEGLTDLQKGNVKEVEFITMEEGLYLRCELANDGYIICNGKANNYHGNSLNFKIQSDLGSLDIFVDELNVVIKSYPLLGSLE